MKKLSDIVSAVMNILEKEYNITELENLGQTAVTEITKRLEE